MWYAYLNPAYHKTSLSDSEVYKLRTLSSLHPKVNWVAFLIVILLHLSDNWKVLELFKKVYSYDLTMAWENMYTPWYELNHTSFILQYWDW